MFFSSPDFTKVNSSWDFSHTLYNLLCNVGKKYFMNLRKRFSRGSLRVSRENGDISIDILLKICRQQVNMEKVSHNWGRGGFKTGT